MDELRAQLGMAPFVPTQIHETCTVQGCTAPTETAEHCVEHVPCSICAEYDREHDSRCPNSPEYDPTPWCLHCGPKSACDCGPFAEND